VAFTKLGRDEALLRERLAIRGGQVQTGQRIRRGGARDYFVGRAHAGSF